MRFLGIVRGELLMPEVWPKKSAQTERIRSNLRATAVAQMVELLRSIGPDPGVIITAQVWSMEILRTLWLS